LISFIQINSLEFKNVDNADEDCENSSCEMDMDVTAPIVHDIVE
jgi:hypothetical protein